MEGRKARALQQRLYLWEADYTKDGPKSGWRFLVQGSTGSRYNVSITSNSLFCNCFDCKTRRAICKHIYFIIGRVAADSELLEDMGNSLTAEILGTLTPKLLGRLGGRRASAEVSEPREAPRDTMCSICYEDLVPKEADTCGGCRNGFHKECLGIWLRSKETCPMCRKEWVTLVGEDDFGISKLSIH